MTALEDRPRVGHMVVPFMVDEAHKPINFARIDPKRIDECARRGLCGVCGKRIRRGPIAFIGPNDGRTCFADPWMHSDCADVAMEQCPFLSGRRDWRELEGRLDPLTSIYSRSMVKVLVNNWRSHRDADGRWHFEAIGPVVR